VCSLAGDGDVLVERQPLPTIPDELLALFDRSELAKYMTEPELSAPPEGTD
jgi:succinate dehydrogenase / fumarate reductase flavoprotein subunit